MVYVLDTNIFRKLLDHFPKKGKAFEAVWEAIDEKIASGELISVDECFNEIVKHFSEENLNYQWVKRRREMFKNPTDVESLIIRDLFQSKKMRECIHTKNIIENRPAADVYLAAKAKVLNATLVTTETYKPNSAQLPNLCEKLGVACISFDDFMEIFS